jgi:hypothetical protein
MRLYLVTDRCPAFIGGLQHHIGVYMSAARDDAWIDTVSTSGHECPRPAETSWHGHSES